jgi:LuxR family maltose regulon positive regulatory protein
VQLLPDSSNNDRSSTEPASGEGILVATKLHIPRTLPGRVARPALVGTLRRATSSRLILISATAGAGKTTLLASWHADPLEDRPFAWLSLDERDNDGVRFWGGVLSALRTVEEGFGARVDGPLRTPGADLVERALPLLVNALDALCRATVLVIDDYHLIGSPDVHRALQFVIDNLPDSAQIALATRSDPPLALARLRARAELCELRAADLRLSLDEAAALLNGSLCLDLEAEEIRSLHERTEGWAAGLQLVGLSLKGRSDRRRSIASFAGDDRHIVDYFGAEVLQRQSDATRAFLLRTAILDGLCGPLCDAVCEATGSAQMLDDLERRNLFLISLDGRRVWYRYHHLFRDLLAHELQLAEPLLVAQLHRRAYCWHLREGLISEAIGHATAAGDFTEAGELIAAHWLTYVNRGELETVEAWVRALPDERAEADPRVCLARAWMLLVLGRPAEVEPAVRAAERGTLPGPMRDGSRSVESSAAMVRTSARLLLGDVGGAAQAAERAAELEPDPHAPWRSMVANAVGMAAYWSGAPGKAAAAFEQSVSSATTVGYSAARIYALGYLAVIWAERGDFAQAEALIDAAHSVAGGEGLADHWVTAMVHFAVAECAVARGELEAARAAAERGLGIARRGGLRLDVVYGLLSLARIAMSASDLPRARDRQADAERELAGCPDPGILRERVRCSAITARQRSVASGAIAEQLSERERDVLRLLATSLTLREIGAELYVSVNTVKTHARHLYEKLQVSGREEAIRHARDTGLL